MAPLSEIPDVQTMPVFSGEQQFGIPPVFDHVRCAPLAGDGDVMAQVPRKIVAKVLRSPINFPATERLEIVVIQGEDAARTIAAGRAQCAQVDAIGSTVNRVRAAVA